MSTEREQEIQEWHARLAKDARGADEHEDMEIENRKEREARRWAEIEETYGQEARSGDAVAQYTGEEFAALDGEYQTTEVLLYVAGNDVDGWIITSDDVYADGEKTTDGGINQAGESVYRTADKARAAAIKFAGSK